MHLNDIPSKEFMPGLHGKIVHGEQLSWAFWKVQQGAIGISRPIVLMQEKP